MKKMFIVEFYSFFSKLTNKFFSNFPFQKTRSNFQRKNILLRQTEKIMKTRFKKNIIKSKKTINSKKNHGHEFSVVETFECDPRILRGSDRRRSIL